MGIFKVFRGGRFGRFPSKHDHSETPNIKSCDRISRLSGDLVIYGNCSGLHLTVLLGGPWFIHKRWLLFNQNNRRLLTRTVWRMLAITKEVSAPSRFQQGSERRSPLLPKLQKESLTPDYYDNDQRFRLSSQSEARPISIKLLRKEKRKPERYGSIRGQHPDNKCVWIFKCTAKSIRSKNPKSIKMREIHKIQHLKFKTYF